MIGIYTSISATLKKFSGLQQTFKRRERGHYSLQVIFFQEIDSDKIMKIDIRLLVTLNCSPRDSLVVPREDLAVT